MKAVGLFAGIGGIELGLHSAGVETTMLCEVDEAARAVLRSRFGLAPSMIRRDVTSIRRVPRTDVLAAGFPCQDLSQAGRKAGIGGDKSSLVSHVFRLLDGSASPTWLLFENVLYMLRLDRGRAMAYLVSELETRGYAWAYRVLDARSFGVAQRRQRVILLASRTEDPRSVLFADEAGTEYDDRVGGVDDDTAYGFYWTEGLRGLGWAKNAVPTIKGGSALGIPSAPAVWVPATGEIGTPGIEDLEALQGFDRDWTAPATELQPGGNRSRWRLVGNAVCPLMSEWVGGRLQEPGDVVATLARLEPGSTWPMAACGTPRGQRWTADATISPMHSSFSLLDTVSELRPLSVRATAGFLNRAERGRLRFADGFIDALYEHLASQRDQLEQTA